ncbi:hypothetical protein [Planomonospora venezuelensis]|uniref:Secreted protein n=1 Tax=Planomonospora venezuelensis TaxID=1999 RepID=A0A841DIZ4_PLAVE|nr:hypothetical protein [Planomonospora venezuelensis]MBB5968045.1 hypothetical protein [Planomonospora venezuelensis]GIN04662.1 hypothetical protein Pve01_63200 [Planomonospora venezuelensis]
MRKRSSVLAVLGAAAVLAAPTAAAADAAAQGSKDFSFRGMNLKIPAAWKVHDYTDRVLVVTGGCKIPEPFAPDCRGFWLYGPKVIAYGAEGRRYTGRRPFVPAAGAPVGCPFEYGSVQVIGKAVSTGLRQVGRGHRAKYTAWAGRCVKQKSGRQTESFVQREWFLPASGIVVVDVWGDRKLAGLLKNAGWS